MVDLDSAVRRCMDIVDDESDISLDVMILGTGGYYATDNYSLKSAMDTISQMTDPKDGAVDLLIKFIEEHPDVNLRLIMQPSRASLEDYNAMDFDGSNTAQLLEAGIADATRIIDTH